MQDAVTSLPLGDLYDTHLELTRGWPRETAPAVLLNSAVICFASCASWPNSLVREDQLEVSPLSRAVMLPRGSTAIHFITKWPSLAPPSPTRRPVSSPYGSLSLTGRRRAYHVPHADPNGLGPAFSPMARLSVSGEVRAPLPGHLPFGSSLAVLRRHSPFGLSVLTTFTSGSHVLTIPFNPGSQLP